MNALSYSPTISFQALQELLSETIQARGWKDFKVTKVLQEFHPYFTFNFYVVPQSKPAAKPMAVEGSESEAEIENEAEEESRGFLAYNPLTNQFEDDLSEALENAENPKPFTPPDNKKGKKFEIALLETDLSLDEAKKLISLKLAKDYSVNKDEVVVTQLKLVHVPSFFVSFSAAGKDLEWEVNGITGEFESDIEDLKQRQKTKKELWNETMKEIQDPNMWMHYLSELFKGTGGSAWSFFKTANKAPKKLFILILIIIIIVFYAYLRGWIG